ncbi:hypothetical protein FA95DRAFT_742063 [Auriscalpium vulgare]|uniref:Uncharacterized protein n=1 Tax=Auriscalpium vulgare TaxID=40419 RepID=A0ACB8SA00_9AGAM|nr:hypothetical protein FA95DRAFT_742063 [Auriscalpium vulgare]
MHQIPILDRQRGNHAANHPGSVLVYFPVFLASAFQFAPSAVCGSIPAWPPGDGSGALATHGSSGLDTRPRIRNAPNAHGTVRSQMRGGLKFSRAGLGPGDWCLRGCYLVPPSWAGSTVQQDGRQVRTLDELSAVSVLTRSRAQPGLGVRLAARRSRPRRRRGVTWTRMDPQAARECSGGLFWAAGVDERACPSWRSEEKWLESLMRSACVAVSPLCCMFRRHRDEPSQSLVVEA